MAEGFIHVHHLQPLSQSDGERVVDPISDLWPVCPNCHFILHRRSPPYTIDELKALLNGQVIRAVAADLRPSAGT